MVGMPVVSAPPPAPGVDGAMITHPPATVRPPELSPPPRSAPRRRTPRAAAPASGARARRRPRHAGVIAFLLAVLVVIGSAAYLALQSVYFIGTDNRGLVTLFQGLPYRLPGNVTLYSSQYVSGVSASTLSLEKRRTLLDHSLRSEANAAALIRSLELEQLE